MFNKKISCLISIIGSLLISLSSTIAFATPINNKTDKAEQFLPVIGNFTTENVNKNLFDNDFFVGSNDNSITVKCNLLKDDCKYKCYLFEGKKVFTSIDSKAINEEITVKEISKENNFVSFDISNVKFNNYTIIITELQGTVETVVLSKEINIPISTPALILKEISAHSVKFEITNLSKIDQYEVYRNNELVDTFDASNKYFTDDCLEANQSYEYKFRAVKNSNRKVTYSNYSETISITTLNEYGLPNVSGQCKTYAYYTAVTATESPQYKLLNSDSCYTDKETGIRMIGDCYCIALGSYYGSTIGTKYKITLSSGQSFNAILCDQKANRHTDENNQYAVRNQDIIEFYVEGKNIPAQVNGSYDCIFKGSVVSIEQLKQF